MRRLLAAAGVVVASLLLLAAPAGADPARPTNFLSVLTSITPPTGAATLRVVGGDGFLDLSVRRGHSVTVLGYVGEPYLRVLADGTVEQNLNSPAYYLNKSRFGTKPVPAALEGEHLPAPKWKVTGHGGHAVWHDHRIHFMSHTIPPELAHGQRVAWSVRFTVDGAVHVAHGNYRLLPAPPTLLWLALLLAVAVATWALGRRRAVRVASIATLVAAPIALVLGWNQDAVVPKAAGGTPLIVVLPVLALLGAIGGLALRTGPARVRSVLVAVACEAGWFLSRTSVLWKAVIPTQLSAAVDRTGSTIVIALAVAAAVLVVRSGEAVPTRPPAAPPPPA